MIGYYIHHHGRGHLHRAVAIAAALGQPVTGLSSLPRPDEWAGDWVRLPLDLPGEGGDADALRDVGANGRLHWVPLGVAGLRERMAAISAWIGAARPAVIVTDVSVEVSVLARLHGVPVVSVALPGERGDDAHRLGFDVSTAIIAAWPPEAGGMVTGLSLDAVARLHPVGAISRFPRREAGAARTPRRVLVLAGAGGDGFGVAAIAAARAAAPEWEWEHLGGSSGRWSDDPREALSAADVVITHAGQNALADVAAARRPAIVVPQTRPHDEQRTTARVLSAGHWPALLHDHLPEDEWPGLLARAAALGGEGWRSWNDGLGAERAAAVITDVAAGRMTRHAPPRDPR